jgi:iron complex transport system permease protein
MPTRTAGAPTVIARQSPGTTGRRRVTMLLAALALLGVMVVLSLTLGTRATPFDQVITALFSPETGNTDHVVIRELRVPRTLIGLAVGAALALAGTVMQGITRNPLGDPGLLGVNAGASLFVVLAITVLGITTPLGFIWFAFIGAAAAAALVYGVASLGREGATPVKLALAGTAVTAAVTSAVTLLLISDVDTLNTYRFWQVGSLAGRGLAQLEALWPFLLVGAVLAVVAARTLNLLSLGDDLARGLGQNLAVARIVAGVAVVMLCGAATSIAGPIVFVGLVIPHIARAIVGPDYRWIVVYSAVLGPVLLLLADVIGRLVVQPGELEAGLVVALVGAPAMIALVRRVKLAGL